MTTTKKAVIAMAVVSIVAVVLVAVTLQERFYGPIVGSLAVCAVWGWCIWKLAGIIDADMKWRREQEMERIAKLREDVPKNYYSGSGIDGRF